MDPVYGLIQHSFALQRADWHQPFAGRTVRERVNERFSTIVGENGKFAPHPVGAWLDRKATLEAASHSPLGEHHLTTVGSRQMQYLQGPGNTEGPLPPALRWAKDRSQGCPVDYGEPRLIFTDTFEDEHVETENDFLVQALPLDTSDGAAAISKTLLELMAHKRSRLFGFALANRFVNVMLPHAVLQLDSVKDGSGAWFVQPLVSFIRGGRNRNRLRKTYSLTFFLVPILESGDLLLARRMSKEEIKKVVNLNWSLAVAFPADPTTEFNVAGPLLNYLSCLAKHDICGEDLGGRYVSTTSALSAAHGPFTLRQTMERIAFGVGLSVAQGKSRLVTLRVAHLIGNDVITALGSARVSSVVVVDPDLTAHQVKGPRKSPAPYPGNLEPLMETLSGRIRAPRFGDGEARKYRLDRPFVDDDIYVAGVLPTQRCIIVVSRGDAQWGSRESALMQAGSVAYMTLGAATAIGTMRDIDRRLEWLEGADDPLSIAKIDAEVAADLGEIYDLDITAESYREFYRRLRIRLGISRDYKILQDKMQALYRATSTAHEHKAEQRLTWLTAAIVILSAFILIGTVVLVGNGG
jgi:hypothetical protein